MLLLPGALPTAEEQFLTRELAYTDDSPAKHTRQGGTVPLRSASLAAQSC